MDEAGTLREFMREMVLRMERATRAQVAGFETLTATVREELAETRGEMRELREAFYREMEASREKWASEMQDLRDESRAQREALLWILDQLRNGPGPATAGG